MSPEDKVTMAFMPPGLMRHHPGRADGLPRRNAFWASWVMASASSSITSLKPLLEGGQGFKSTSNGCRTEPQGATWSGVLLEDGPGAGEAQDGTSDHIDASVV
ncbi:hypothetical protein EYF80_044407 [Liparis tanakae]|uniref:Uncharacterized protein n=1 Tax=Liparis tanakae TaxID=230148 RepID=A0A4Z2FVX9_9TELE|nr:hypothetical protein EYF80_044407 [Liparis tanakae]